MPDGCLMGSICRGPIPAAMFSNNSTIFPDCRLEVKVLHCPLHFISSQSEFLLPSCPLCPCTQPMNSVDCDTCQSGHEKGGIDCSHSRSASGLVSFLADPVLQIQDSCKRVDPGVFGFSSALLLRTSSFNKV